METTIKEHAQCLHKIVDTVGSVIIGKTQVVELVVFSLISGGHVLIEDIPGVGKTSLINALAQAVGCDYSRIQFTPDIMPSDITGFSIYNQKIGEFEFRPGAAMSNFVLADEINRASAKAQSSLLEVMEEKQITVDSHTYKMKEPFIVLATQNPVDNLGTHPLPEAQIDRFQIRVSLGYPSFEEEVRIVDLRSKKKRPVPPVASGADILRIREMVDLVSIDQSLAEYIIRLTAATRSHPSLSLGASPRGSISLYRMCQAKALYKGRDYVIPDDVKALIQPVLAHRLILSHQAKMNQISAQDVIDEILQKTSVPHASSKLAI